MKFKHEEEELVKQAQKAEEKYMMKEEHSDDHLKAYLLIARNNG
ncbi:hypothetical protein JOD45_002056 [Scopulibacillus daqui]|uniref:Uncharacterized protein n=1 Tax=Scopulibacillus daqui TaxID=1469162 RepID=A0ABS2Q0L5_9BACL|nr:hypothetical protein [Scopulibacillus daqui]MBM7645837.1 hypothetical protein [Scopulibacillus daqui]